jgi:hypothetical protein
MACIVEFNSDIRFNFVQNPIKQKLLMDALLNYSKLDLIKMAVLLNSNEEKLVKVYEGEEYFENEMADELGKLFLILFSQ